MFTAITDCGAGGFSSAVGEMGKELGAEVRLEAANPAYEPIVLPADAAIAPGVVRVMFAPPTPVA